MNPVRVTRLVSALLATCALFAFAPAAHAQGRGTITGTVTDATSGDPIQGARILLDGTNISVVTNQQGQFSLRNVPLGPQSIRAIMIGYDMGRAQVNVTSAPVPVNFQLTKAVVNLDAIVVTATGDQRKREVANSVASIDAAKVAEEFAPTNIGSMIQGRAAGVQILNGSGTTGTSQQIRIRGSSSISLSNEPLLVVDGIRVENSPNSNSFGVGGQTISRMNDFNPEDIESIEVVKGPAASAMYGTQGANGVIVIKTKRGRAGRPRWQAYVEQGIMNDFTDWPDNYRGLDASGSSCRLSNVAAGSCTQASIRTANPLESNTTSPFQTGHREQYGLSVAGGSEETQYFVGGEWEVENGIYGLPDGTKDSIRTAGGTIPDHALNPSRLERAHIRANIQSQLGDKADIRVATGFVSSDTWLPQNDNNVLGLLPSGLLGGTDSTVSGGWGFFTPEEIFFIEGKQAVERFTGSTSLNYRPTTWLNIHATGGIDYTGRRDVRFNATGTGPGFGTFQSGDRISNRTAIFRYTADVGATAQFQLTDDISSKTTATFQFFRRNFEQTTTQGQNLAPGSGSNASASTQFIGEAFVRSRTVGGFVEQVFGYKDRLFVNGALRADDNSAFGQDLSLTYYPRIGVSYLPIESGIGILDQLKVRGAFGRSGQQPGTNAAVKFFTGTAVVDDNGEQVGVSISGAGNPGLKPEKSEEIEVGIEAGLFGGRASFEGTYYRRTTKDALISRRLAPSLGLTTSRFDNIGKTRNWGWEGIINAQIIDGENFSWETTLSGSTNDNEILQLGEGVEPITFGSQRHAEGYPLGAFFDETFTFNDANGDGIISTSELNFDLDGDGATDSTVFLGYPLPRYEASWFNAFTLFNGRIRVSGLFDYRGGHKKYNLTEAFRCGFNICKGLNDPSSSLEEQANAQTRRSGVNTAAGFLEPGWFIKMRELALTFNFPDSFAKAVRTDRLSLTLTGRNLFTITDYKGADPEVEQFSGAFGSRDFLTQPQVRMWFARLNVAF